MPNCPSCNREITSLNYSQNQTLYGTAWLEDGIIQIEEGETEDTGEWAARCPNCDWYIGSYALAQEFLRGRGTTTPPRTIRVSPTKETPKLEEEKLIGLPFEDARSVIGEEEAEFIQTLQDYDLWYCMQCGKVERKKNLIKCDSPESNEFICEHCKEAIE